MGESDSFVDDLRTYVDKLPAEKSKDISVTYCQPDGSQGVTVSGLWYNLNREDKLLIDGEQELILELVANRTGLNYKHSHFKPDEFRFYLVVDNIRSGIAAVEKIIIADESCEQLKDKLISKRKEDIQKLLEDRV